MRGNDMLYATKPVTGQRLPMQREDREGNDAGQRYADSL